MRKPPSRHFPAVRRLIGAPLPRLGHVLLATVAIAFVAGSAESQEETLRDRVTELTQVGSLQDGNAQERKAVFDRFQDVLAQVMEEGDVDLGLTLTLGARRLFPEEAKVHIDAGSFLLWNGRIDEARKAFRTALDKKSRLYPDPDGTLRTLALNNLAAILIEDGEVKQALSYLEDSRQREPDRAQTYFLLGTAHLESGEPEKAITFYARAVELDPAAGTSVDYVRYATCFRKTERNARAREVLEHALRVHPLEPALHYYLGASYYDDDRLLEAYCELQTEFYIHRRDSPVYQQTLDLLRQVLERGREREADGEVYRYPELERVIRAQEVVRERPEAAARLFEGAIPDSLATPILYVFVGEAFFAAENPERAAAAFEKAIGGNPYLVPAYLDLARTYKALGRTDDARAATGRALLLDPENWKIVEVIGKLEEGAEPEDE
jgi:tetratricopeptide (TPR) repeat protein